MSEKTRLCPFSFALAEKWYKPQKLKDMDYKLEYMERLFAKISKKKTESYVISRISSEEHKTSMRSQTCICLNSIFS